MKRDIDRPAWATGGHWLDRLYNRVANDTDFFLEGWGDLTRWQTDGFLEPLLDFARAFTDDKRAPVEIEWGKTRRTPRLRLQYGTFRSPCAHLLPPESHTANIMAIWPRQGRPSGVCVHMAATGDEGFARRRLVALELARTAGIGAILLENPFYGQRKPAGQRGVMLRTIDELCAMGFASIVEGMALLGWLRSQGHEQLGLAGVSMGGQMAMTAAAAWPHPVAVAPFIASHSAQPVFTEGLISRHMRWDKLAQEHAGDVEAARMRLVRLLETTDVRLLPPPVRSDAAVLVSARRDAYVPRLSAQVVQSHWPGARLLWIPTGHVGGFIFHRRTFQDAIKQSFKRLTRPPSLSSSTPAR